MQRQLTFGGGVSPRSTRLRGQSIIEYVLIIAVIGLVIVFAGPGVAGAIRNQFNLVGNTVNGGTAGGVEGGGASGGGSTGADSATVQAAIAKDAKEWTLDEQEAVAEDIAAKGEASPAYAKAKAAMDAWTRWSIKLANGATMRYRIVGINHDDLADGSGKAGLTFLTTNIVTDAQKMNASHTNVGGWEKSKLRERLNSGDLWALLPAELAGKIEPVEKMTDNQGGGKAGVPTATTDRVFLLSTTEIYGNLDSDGTQYEFYAAKGVTQDNYSVVGVSRDYWTRSTYKWDSEQFMVVTNSGEPFHSYAANTTTTYFAWCF